MYYEYCEGTGSQGKAINWIVFILQWVGHPVECLQARTVSGIVAVVKLLGQPLVDLLALRAIGCRPGASIQIL